ncbi:TetR/AcrR family transcriptional regulator [Kineosporia babensis]|uniref:TetR/AcrR family transcriptional regulator n=1 Tax=Kineosporia babensis TaxID=499548 RepID=A0A9X1NIR9_9ACTN|nr:TetR/AcrR family transcriptional regulator [Kineosporia babensis]MCD5314825.1 TetR/AcrR family transcriptional regulator [Kineosporia babensis]
MSSVEQGGRRTRLSPEREAELYTAVLELLGEVGYEALTMPGVAARSRSSTATLYRQWGGKPGLVAAALMHRSPLPDFSDIDTGSLREDLLAMTLRVLAIAPEVRKLMAGLAHAAMADQDLGTAMRAKFAQPGEVAVQEALRRAEIRGEIAQGHPAGQFAGHLLIALTIVLPSLDGRELDAAYVAEFLDVVLIPAFRG